MPKQAKPQTAIRLTGDYYIKRGWIDASGQTRDWDVIAPDGKTLATVVRKYQGEGLARLMYQRDQEIAQLRALIEQMQAGK